MTRFSENEQHWIEEQKESIYIDKMDANMMSVKYADTEGFIIENNLGLPIVLYIQSIVGEKEPREEYQEFQVDAEGLLFLKRADLLSIRKRQAEDRFGESLRLIAEDILRIMIKTKDWEYVGDIPIEISGYHSFLFSERISKLHNKSVRKSYPAICRVQNSVITYIIIETS